MGNGLIKCDLTLETYFTYGNSASVITRPVLQRRAGQPIAMRSGRKTDRGCAGQVRLHGENVLQVHGHRIADIAVSESGRGTGRGEDQVMLFEGG